MVDTIKHFDLDFSNDVLTRSKDATFAKKSAKSELKRTDDLEGLSTEEEKSPRCGRDENFAAITKRGNDSCDKEGTCGTVESGGRDPLGRWSKKLWRSGKDGRGFPSDNKKTTKRPDGDRASILAGIARNMGIPVSERVDPQAKITDSLSPMTSSESPTSNRRRKLEYREQQLDIDLDQSIKLIQDQLQVFDIDEYCSESGLKSDATNGYFFKSSLYSLKSIVSTQSLTSIDILKSMSIEKLLDLKLVVSTLRERVQHFKTGNPSLNTRLRQLQTTLDITYTKILKSYLTALAEDVDQLEASVLRLQETDDLFSHNDIVNIGLNKLVKRENYTPRRQMIQQLVEELSSIEKHMLPRRDGKSHY
jgi:hypothetical protein